MDRKTLLLLQKLPDEMASVWDNKRPAKWPVKYMAQRYAKWERYGNIFILGWVGAVFLISWMIMRQFHLGEWMSLLAFVVAMIGFPVSYFWIDPKRTWYDALNVLAFALKDEKLDLIAYLELGYDFTRLRETVNAQLVNVAACVTQAEKYFDQACKATHPDVAVVVEAGKEVQKQKTAFDGALYRARDFDLAQFNAKEYFKKALQE